MKSNNIILGIDTSCYTTSIAAISLNNELIYNEKIILNAKNLGLRQSEAVFQHINNLGKISDNINEIMKNYNICAICASKAPRPVKNSYMPVFMVGYNFAKLLSTTLNVDFFETTHQENHIAASLYTNKIKNEDKFLSVHMSGGTSEILLVNKKDNKYDIKIVAATNDISFGQIIDRVGVKLGYTFPCGKYIDENAINCSETLEVGLKTSTKEGYMNLSGLENQINKIIDKKDDKYISKLLLNAIVKTLEKSLLYVCQKYNVDEVVFAGGVSASKYISTEINKRLSKKNIHTYFTKPNFATDNAFGCAIIGLNNMMGVK